MSERISLRSTFLMKWLFPLFWFGFLIFFLVESLTYEEREGDMLFIAVIGVMAVMGYFFFKALLWDLADAVYDQGAYLLVRRGRVEDRIPFENIMNVSAPPPLMSPPRITIRLVKPSVFGRHISFSPKSNPLRFFLSSKNLVAEQLMERAYAARGRPSG